MNRFIQLGALLFVGILLWWTLTADFSSRNDQETGASGPYLELFMHQFEMTRMNQQGKPAYRLQGDKLERYSDSKLLRISKPVFYLLQDGSRWKISAESALVDNGEKTILLSDNVLMQQQDAEPPLNLHTDSMLIHTDTQLALTDDPVNIEHGYSRLRAQGMVFNNLSHELQLKAKIRGYYLPYE